MRTVGSWLGRRLVAGAVKRQAGLASVRYAGIGGSFVAPDSLRWFWALGVPVREQYGQVETGGIVTTQGGERDLGTAGSPIDPAVEVRLDGEQLLVRGPGTAIGTLDGSAVTGEDGWFATGDLARIDDEGRVVPIGRQAHVLTTASGDGDLTGRDRERSQGLAVHPQRDGRRRRPAVRRRPRRARRGGCRRLGAATRDLGLDLRGARRERAGQRARRGGGQGRERRAAGPSIACSRSGSSRSRSGDELTPTGKIRRGIVEQRYAELIDEMYAEQALSRREIGVADA